MHFRHKFQIEEANEYHTHHQQAEVAKWDGDKAEYTFQLGEMLDSFTDQLYVLVGTMYLHGIPVEVIEEAWSRVHAKNMLKVRASDVGQSKRGSTLDVVKPEGWEPPTFDDLVEVNDINEG